MSPHPWTPDIELEASSVAGIVADRFPELRPVNAEYLDEGWDYFAFEVNGHLIFRFPKRADGQDGLALEASMLPILSRHLPLPVPEPVFLGEPGPDFGRVFLGHRKILGTFGSLAVPPDGSFAVLAAEMGEFLSRLHALPADEARRLGVPEWPWTIREELLREYEKCLDSLSGMIPADLSRRCRDFAAETFPGLSPWPGAPRLIHSDLLPEHLLFDPGAGRISGVIDWGDMACGDPSADFVGLSMWLGEEFVQRALEHYDGEVDDGFPGRIRFRAVWTGLEDISYGTQDSRPECIETGLRALRLNLPPG